MRTAEQWAKDLEPMVDVVEKDPPHIGVYSRGEQCAIALVLDMPELRPSGFTWLDCVQRIEPELLGGALLLQRRRS